MNFTGIRRVIPLKTPLILSMITVVSLTGTGTVLATANTDAPAAITDATSDLQTTATPTVPPVDLEHLPLGDGKVSTEPQTGYVWSCQTEFNGGGAFTNGDWIHSDGTWDKTAKTTVDGEVTWANALFTITVAGDERLISGNDLPNHPTGIYPIQSSDDAYQVDRNPNSIQEQTLSFTLPLNPTVGTTSSCLPMGVIGIVKTGSVLFNALDAAGRDAAAHEVQDNCDGHPERSGEYHYHSVTACLNETEDTTQHSELIGYALDGFGIYGERGEAGVLLTNADLDECHGHTHEIEWEEQTVVMYHYHATAEYPYTLGCFRGTPIQVRPSGGQPPQGGNGGNQPPRPPQGGSGGGQPPQPPQGGNGQPPRPGN